MKTFYIVSALSDRSTSLGERVKYDTEVEAVEKAKKLVEQRQAKGTNDLNFYVLKAISIVGTEKPAIEVKKLEE